MGDGCGRAGDEVVEGQLRGGAVAVGDDGVQGDDVEGCGTGAEEEVGAQVAVAWAQAWADGRMQ